MQRRLPHAVLTLAVTAGALLGAASPGKAIGRAGPGPTVIAETVATGLAFPATFAFLPDGRIVYGERFTGQIRLLDPATGDDTLFFALPNVASEGERGLLGLAVNPRHPARPYVYAYYTRDAPTGFRNRIVRLKDLGGHAESFRTLVTLRAGLRHNGGPIGFGPDRKLYGALGDAHREEDAQSLDILNGKVIRMAGDGSVPATNPFPGSFVFSLGHRNMFGFDHDPVTGTLWLTENGPTCNDEINLVEAGRNHGWGPAQTCLTPPDPPANTNQDGRDPVLPAIFFTPTIAPTGGAFCVGCGLGTGTEGTFLFGAWNDGVIRLLTPTPDRSGVSAVDALYDHPSGVLSLETGPDGAIYFSDATGIHRLSLAP